MCDLRKLRHMPESATSVESQNGQTTPLRRHLKSQFRRTVRKLRLLQTLRNRRSMRKLRIVRREHTLRTTTSNVGDNNGK